MSDRELDDRLDAQLRAAFTPPPASVFEAAARRVAQPRPSRWPWLIAAAALLVALALAFSRPRRGPEGHDGAQLGAMWVAAYEQALSDGFEGACCDAGVDYRAACRERFAIGLDVVADGGVKVVGCYCGSMPTGGCMGLLAMAKDTPVFVCVLPRAQDPRARLPEGSSFALTRRELGGVVLYAIARSPADDALAGFVTP